MITLRSLSLLSITVVAACGSTPAPSAPSTRPAADGPPYAALFVDGERLRWTFVDERTSDENEVTRDEATASCTVEARALGAWQVARQRCDELPDTSLASALTAVYVADARGVWRAEDVELPTDEAGAAALAVGDPLLAAAPVVTPPPDDAEVEAGWSTVTQAEHGWCHRWGDSSGSDEVCFDAGRGLTRVSSVSDGGTVHEAWFERAR